MNDAHVFPVTVQWTAGKQGTAWSRSLPFLPVATPPEFGGPPAHWSPEHLFAASVASCLMSTFVSIAAHSGLLFTGLVIPASATVERGEGRGFRITEVTLRPSITVAREADREKAEHLLHKAHDACLVSGSIRSTVNIIPTFELAPTEEEMAPLVEV